MRLKPIGLSLLLIIGATNAFASPGDQWRRPREDVRAYHFQSISVERDNSRNAQQGQQPEQRRDREQGYYESSGYGSQGQSRSNSSSDNMRRQQGRMSPEERRALRRQIDEVSHDIYVPRR